jgi:hypothetical protein
VFCAVEKHAAAQGVSAPVFAAVRQYKDWAAGKKVEKSEFEKAVRDFLNAPVGGWALPNVKNIIKDGAMGVAGADSTGNFGRCRDSVKRDSHFCRPGGG